MLSTLNELDQALFFFLNGLHTDFLDQPMFLISGTLIWIPLYLFLLWLVFRFKGWKKMLMTVVILVLVVAAADQVASSLLKPNIKRWRPSRDPQLMEQVHIVNNYRGGKYGFASSHAANTFALAAFFFLLFRKRHKQISWLWLWAFVVSYSRIYLGVHYPGDILAGAGIGVISGSAGWKILENRL